MKIEIRSIVVFLFALSVISRAQRPELVIPMGHTTAVTAAAISPNGSYLVAGDQTGSIILWDIASGKKIRSYQSEFSEKIERLAFSPDGSQVTGTDRHGTSRTFNVVTGKLTAQPKIPLPQPHPDGEEQLADLDGFLSPAGKFCARQKDEQAPISFYDAATEDWLWNSGIGKAQKGFLHSDYKSFSADDELVLGADWDKRRVSIWQTRSAALISDLDLEKSAIFDLEGYNNLYFFLNNPGPGLPITPDHKQVLIHAAFNDPPDGVEDRTEVWDLATGMHRGSFEGKPLMVSADSKYLLVKRDSLLAGIDLASGRTVIQIPPDPPFELITSAFSPDGKHLAAFEGSDQGLQVKLWEFPSGKLLRSLSLQSPTAGNFYALRMKWLPSGKHLYLFNPYAGLPGHDSRIILCELPAMSGPIPIPESLKLFHLDKQDTVLLVQPDLTLLLWDLRQQRVIQSFRNYANRSLYTTFSPNGESILSYPVSGPSLTAKLWNLKTGRKIGPLPVALQPDFSPDEQEYTDYAWKINSLPAVFSPGGDYIVTGFGPLRKWDSRTGQLLHEYDAGPGSSGSEAGFVQFTPDGRYLFSSLSPMTSHYLQWEARSGKLLREVELSIWDYRHGINISPDGRFFFHRQSERITEVYDVESGKSVGSMSTWPELLSPTGNDAAAWNWLGDKDKRAIKEQRRRRKLPEQSLVYNPGGTGILVYTPTNRLELKDIASGKTVVQFEGKEVRPKGLSFSADGKLLMGLSDRNTIQLWDVAGGQMGHTLTGHQGEITYLQFSADKRFILSTSKDNTSKIWDVQDGRELLTLVSIDSTDWVVTTPSGLFDASPRAMKLMHYAVYFDEKFEFIELEQLKARYFEPGLLPKILGLSSEPIGQEEILDNVAFFPEVVAGIVHDSLHVRLKERNGGIGRLSLFANNKEIVYDLNPGRRTQLSYDLHPVWEYLFRHPDSVNVISMRAFNAEGWLTSTPIHLPYHPFAGVKGHADQGKAPDITIRDPKMYVITFGTSEYSGEKLDLKYATQDAMNMALALQAVGRNLFAGGDSIEVHCLTTGEADAANLEKAGITWRYADKQALHELMTGIRGRAKAEDVLMVYLSGHGASYADGGPAEFYYLTHNIAEEERLSDTEIRKRYTISSAELTDWINHIPALKQILVIDACKSGTLVNRLTRGDLNSAQVRALDRMRDRTGMFLLAGSAADKVSYEASQYGQGLLTYSLLQGMLGMATRRTSKGEYIDVMNLFQHARNQVPLLAAAIDGVQTPTVGFPAEAASFDIGILNETAKRNIPNSRKKPVIIRCAFLNAGTLRDDLGLAGQLEAKLQEEDDKGADADYTYMDTHEYPDAYSISGLYTLTEDQISLTIKLFKGAEWSVQLDIEPTDDPKVLIRNIIRAVKAHLEKNPASSP